MKNRDKWRGLRARDVKVYPCRVLVENSQPAERVINITTATAISRENRKQAKEIVKARRRERKSGPLPPDEFHLLYVSAQVGIKSPLVCSCGRQSGPAAYLCLHER